MSALSFHDLRDANLRRCEQVFHPIDEWSPTDWFTAAAGELGEGGNKIKKLRRGEAIPLEDVAYELADAVIYIDLLCQRMGIDLGSAVVEKFNIVSARRGSDVTL